MFDCVKAHGHSLAILLVGCGASIAVCAAATAVPDISGTWQVQGSHHNLRTLAGTQPPLLPPMRAVYEQHLAARKAGDTGFDPMAKCLPPGVPRLLMQPYPFTIVQGKKLYGFVFEWNHLNRIVYMDQDHFEPIGPLYLGQSIGHWDGSTLVIDTNSYNDMTLLDDAGLPHTDALHTVEHIRLLSSGQLEDRIRIEDAGAYASAWETVLRFSKRPNAIVTEDYCLGRIGHGALKQQ